MIPQNIKTNGKCRFQIPFKGSTLYQPCGADPPNIWAIVIAGQIPQLVNADAKTGCRFFKGQISFFPNGNLVFQPVAPAFPKYFSIFVLCPHLQIFLHLLFFPLPDQSELLQGQFSFHPS